MRCLPPFSCSKLVMNVYQNRPHFRMQYAAKKNQKTNCILFFAIPILTPMINRINIAPNTASCRCHMMMCGVTGL